ncbi:MAG: hypothetical protein GXY44_06990 [Phycisphaerales bacterium]|nr:hypothetical protein [Phycisphaerales bacterium]
MSVMIMTACASAEAIVLGQVDDFQDETAIRWWSGTASVSKIATGGPAGLGDQYLQVSTTAYPEGRQLMVNNRMWGGDYVMAGVHSLEVALLNLNPFPLEIRILAPSMDYGVYTSSTAFLIPSDGQWHHTVFSLLEDDMTWVGGSAGDYSMAMRNILSLTIRHQPGEPAYNGPAIVASFGIDNIRATPEPGTLVLFPLLFLAVGKKQRP